MNEQLTGLLNTLSAPQRVAVEVVQFALDLYNSKEGEGLFAGATRYNTLAARLEICAVQADGMSRFWALLLRRMQWPVPPRSADPRLLALLSAPDGADVLRSLATETASIITLARMSHDEHKKIRRSEFETPETPIEQ
jgi:hypothetical protein